MKRQIIYYECDRCGQRIEDCGNPKLMGERTCSDTFERHDMKVQRYEYDEEGDLMLTPQDFCQSCYAELQAWFQRKGMDKFMEEATREHEKNATATRR